MAFVRIAFFPDGNETHYLAVASALEGAPVPEGRRLFVTGPVNEGWQVVQVWDSKDELDAFNAAWYLPALQRVDVTFPRAPEVTDFEAFDLVLGQPECP